MVREGDCRKEEEEAEEEEEKGRCLLAHTEEDEMTST